MKVLFRSLALLLIVASGFADARNMTPSIQHKGENDTNHNTAEKSSKPSPRHIKYQQSTQKFLGQYLNKRVVETAERMVNADVNADHIHEINKGELDPALIPTRGKPGVGRTHNYQTRQTMRGDKLVIRSVKPVSGISTGGTTVTMTGGVFLETIQYDCKFGNIRVPIISVDLGEIVCISPALPYPFDKANTKVPVTVCYHKGKCAEQSSPLTFTYKARKIYNRKNPATPRHVVLPPYESATAATGDINSNRVRDVSNIENNDQALNGYEKNGEIEPKTKSSLILYVLGAISVLSVAGIIMYRRKRTTVHRLHKRDEEE